ncbi:hypothetical protein FRB94_000945 [Tulasnella sp. JGI-2019a]|nr:hypothetical protein FRB94_000945 [Tulasnella sp. JGI-2019a]KAG9018322.1 hypothetical protein FRB93_000025 [Tulasnella sp. JGI-2019a]KAG9030028.1 hypothetical protein FRB95_004615 [Tulasnella sp. JGI-2019a]
MGVLTEEGLGKDTNPKYDGADGLSFSYLYKANDVYGRPRDIKRIQEVANVRTQDVLDGVELVAED